MDKLILRLTETMGNSSELARFCVEMVLSAVSTECDYSFAHTMDISIITVNMPKLHT